MFILGCRRFGYEYASQTLGNQNVDGGIKTLIRCRDPNTSNSWLMIVSPREIMQFVQELRHKNKLELSKLQVHKHANTGAHNGMTIGDIFCGVFRSFFI